MPPMSTRITRIRTIRTPRKPMPFCRFMCGRSASIEGAEPPRLAQVEPDEERLADDVVFGDEAPHAAVARVVPVVAHHEEVSRRDFARQTGRIVEAILAMGELPHE